MAQHNQLSPLSPREEEVVQLLLQGKGNKLIASALDISVSTVEFHLKNIYAKYQVGSRVELILKLGNTPGGGESEKPGLSTFESIRVCLAKYAEFRGRTSRSEFWWFALFITLVTAALTYLSEALGGAFMIATLLPLLAAGTRRLRDSGKSGWWQLFLLVPVGGIVILGSLWALPPISTGSNDTPPA